MSDRRFMSAMEAAELFGLSLRTIRRRIADGSLPAFRVGPKTIRIKVEDLEKLTRPIPTAEACMPRPEPST